MDLERASFLTIEDGRHVTSGCKVERKRSGQIEVSPPTPGLVIIEMEDGFSNPPLNTMQKKREEIQ